MRLDATTPQAEPGWRGPPAGQQRRGASREAHGVRKWNTTRTEDGGWDASIYQAKPAQVEKLRALLATVPHTEHVRQRSESWLPEHHFKLRRAWVTDLLKRSEVMETGPEGFVLRLSPDQRAAWLDAMIDAEGNRYGKARWRPFIRVSQNDGPLQDAIRLAVDLEGWRPAVRRRAARPHGTVSLCGPHVAVSMFHPPTVMGREDVWCVTTELGTWTMLQDDQVMLTGNAGLAQQL